MCVCVCACVYARVCIGFAVGDGGDVCHTVAVVDDRRDDNSKPVHVLFLLNHKTKA